MTSGAARVQKVQIPLPLTRVTGERVRLLHLLHPDAPSPYISTTTVIFTIKETLHMTPRPLDFLAGLLGAQIPGGCDQCAEPYQSVEHHPSGSWVLTVHHDEGCPVLVNYRRSTP